MALFEVMDEIARRDILKTEAGDTRLWGVVVGLVARNYDKDMPGRICVTIPVRDKDANELKWARLAMPSFGKKWGHYFLPEVGDQVLLAFENGNIDKPYVIGCVPQDNSNFLSGAVDEKNQYKKIVTRYGNEIVFEDNKEGEGEKDKITIRTAKKDHVISMDNENHKITISDKDGKNSIVICDEENAGNIVMKTEKKLTIQVGDNIKMIMDGESGKVSVSCDTFSVSASNAVKMVGNSNVSVTGSDIKVEGSSSMKVSSSGATSVQGSVIKLG